MRLRRYRVNRDSIFSAKYWSVEVWRMWWPFWCEERGLLLTKQDAADLIAMLERGYAPSGQVVNLRSVK